MRPFLAALLCLAVAAPAATAEAATTPGSITAAPVKTVKAGPGKIAYRSVGTGSPVVLVMGLSGTMDAWSPGFVDGIAAAGHRVVIFDNEGIRRSTKGKGTLTIDRMADNTAALIRALKLKRADVLGWSMGGMISQSLAFQYPKLVRSLVLNATAPGDGKGTGPAAQALQALGGSGGTEGLLGLIYPAGQEAARDAYVADILKWPGTMPTAPAAVVNAQLGASALWMMGKDKSAKSYKKLKLPVLIGGGALDELLPVANDQHLADVIPGATLKVFDDAAHGFLFQDQAEWLPQVTLFLK